MSTPLRTSASARAAMVNAERRHALRVSLGLVLPGAALVLAGRPELIIYAAFGSFTGMYGRTDSRIMRLLHQSQGAVLLLAGSAVGIALSQSHAKPEVVIVAATGFVVAGSMLADFFALRPDGPFYGVFALGALAGVAPHLINPWVAWLIVAASAGLALLIGLTGADASPVPAKAVPTAFRELRVRTRPAAMVHAVRYAIAVAAAGTVALAVGLSHVNWAIAGAAVTLAAADPRGRFWKGVNRVVGTLAGLVITALLLLAGLSQRELAIVVIVLLFPTELFMTVNYALALTFFTPLIMLMTELAAPIGVRDLLETRALGTLVGVLCGFVVTYLIRDRRKGSAISPDPAQ